LRVFSPLSFFAIKRKGYQPGSQLLQSYQRKRRIEKNLSQESAPTRKGSVSVVPLLFALSFSLTLSLPASSIFQQHYILLPFGKQAAPTAIGSSSRVGSIKKEKRLLFFHFFSFLAPSLECVCNRKC
jgi:hypothetical protein